MPEAVKYRCLAMIALYSWAITAAAADIASAQQRTIEAETATLLSCEPEKCPVFYVSVLGRVFPIPTRYMFSPSPEAPALRSFVSPVPALSTLEKAVAGKEISGVIMLGTLEELKRSEANGGIKLRLLKTIDGVQIFLLTLDHKRKQEPNYVLVADNQFVQIGDQNPQLHELLLNLSSRVKQAQQSK